MTDLPQPRYTKGQHIVVLAGSYRNGNFNFSKDCKGKIVSVSWENNQPYYGCRLAGFPRWSLQWMFENELQNA